MLRSEALVRSAGSDFGSPEFQGLKPERVQRNGVSGNSGGLQRDQRLPGREKVT